MPVPLVSDVSQTGVFYLEDGMDSQAVKTRKIGLTDHAVAVADELASDAEMSRSEWIEWLIFSQKYSTSEAAKFLGCRRGRGRVHVVPDDAELPPEG